MTSQISEWLQTLKNSKSQADEDDPNYWTANPESLISDAHVENVVFGTGHNIYKNVILPAIATAEKEVILVTCFWARSPTLDALSDALVQLSENASQRGQKIRVRICYSSLSIFQKLFHTSSLSGQVYPPSSWSRKLGLPEPEKLTGLEMEVKSIFILPFSVMHPKFVIVDRKKVFLPSCNVSWEDWFEGCVVMRGNKENQIVPQFLRFYQRFWARGEDLEIDANGGGEGLEDEHREVVSLEKPRLRKSDKSFCWTIEGLQQRAGWTKGLFLPSPHHRNPRFTLPSRPCPPPRPTPLNTFVLSIIRNAKKCIYIRTPNLTSPPILSALLDALKSGVAVDIVTSERLMILEQLVTAGTTTKRRVNKLVKRHKRLLQDYERNRGDTEAIAGLQPGMLRIFFFQPDRSGGREGETEPTQSHLKFINVDDEWTLFGSGNMDRASWYTSQELGIALWSNEIGMDVCAYLTRIMESRRNLYY